MIVRTSSQSFACCLPCHWYWQLMWTREEITAKKVKCFELVHIPQLKSLSHSWKKVSQHYNTKHRIVGSIRKKSTVRASMFLCAKRASQMESGSIRIFNEYIVPCRWPECRPSSRSRRRTWGSRRNAGRERGRRSESWEVDKGMSGNVCMSFMLRYQAQISHQMLVCACGSSKYFEKEWWHGKEIGRTWQISAEKKALYQFIVHRIWYRFSFRFVAQVFLTQLGSNPSEFRAMAVLDAWKRSPLTVQKGIFQDPFKKIVWRRNPNPSIWGAEQKLILLDRSVSNWWFTRMFFKLERMGRETFIRYPRFLLMIAKCAKGNGTRTDHASLTTCGEYSWQILRKPFNTW